MTGKTRVVPRANSRRLADRIGLTGTGLAALTPTDIRAWLDRVRAGQLDAAEYKATLLLVYRTWLIAFFLKALGSGWDVAWHFRFNRDDFAPPHNINLVGDGIAIVLVLCHWYTRFAVDKIAFRLMAGGAALFVASAPIDVINHRINGLDITSWSITHFGLYTGTAIMISGVIRGWRLHSEGLSSRSFVLGALWFFFLENVWFPNQHQEYGVEEIASWDRGHPYAEPSLLQFAASQLGRPVDRGSLVKFSLPVEPWVYPLWAVAAAMLTLVIARRSVGLRWTATTIAVGYVGWRCVLWPILAGVGFPTSAVPFLILAGALAIDLVCLLDLPWPAEAALGTAVTTVAVYLAGFVQSYALVAPPISYWSAPISALILFAGWSALAGLRARRNLTLF
ncbi:MAG: hypothetical protein QOE61_3883 [Micromonosporaceae bacterium]|nr:hypothetical protein [Micromonosporaceae bacterium]